MEKKRRKAPTLSFPEFDENGNITRNTLTTIRRWKYNHEDLLKFIGSAWECLDSDTNVDRISSRHCVFRVGHSPRNGSILRAMRDNYSFWQSAWVCSRRGNIHEFELPKLVIMKVGGKL